MTNRERTSRLGSLDEFAATRGFEPEELSRWGISVEGDVVLIPVLGRHGAWYHREHRPGGSPKYKPRGEGVGNHLYNPLGLGPGADVVWLAEGEFDTLSLVTVGAPAVGVLGAASFDRHWALLYSSALVIVAFDPDSESDEQSKRVGAIMSLFPHVERFDPLKVGGYNDINEWFKADRNDLKAKVSAWSE